MTNNTRSLAALLTIVAVASFTLSDHALVERAMQRHGPIPLACLMPVTVDAAALAA